MYIFPFLPAIAFTLPFLINLHSLSLDSIVYPLSTAVVTENKFIAIYGTCKTLFMVIFMYSLPLKASTVIYSIPIVLIFFHSSPHCQRSIGPFLLLLAMQIP